MFVGIFIIIGALASLSIYNFFLYLSRKHDYSILAFTFYGLIFVFGISLRHIPLTHSFYTVTLKFLLFALVRILEGINLIFFSYTIFNLRKAKIFDKIYFGALVGAGIPLMLFYYFIKNFIFIQLIYIIVALVSTVFIVRVVLVVIKRKKYRLLSEKIRLSGYLIFFVLLLIYMIFNSIRADFPTAYYVAFFALGAVFIYSLIDNFNTEYKNLIALNTKMENMVKERTFQLKQAYDEIEEVSRQKISMFVNFAHETKTPMTIIVNYLEKDIEKRGVSEELSVVKRHVDKVSRNMVDFLDLEKLARNQSFFNHDIIVNLEKLILHKARMFNDIAGKKNIKITTDLVEDSYTMIDPYAVDRILNNLIDNSIKYTNNNGKITITLTRENDLLMLSVSDTGIGISEEQINHIFDPYFQISHAKRNIQGIGMGLSIVKKIIDQLGGTINVESQVHKGTTFTITFAAHEPKGDDVIFEDHHFRDSIDSVTEVTLAPTEFNEDRKTVFIVEDNLEMLAFLQNSMKDSYNVFFALNGKEALEKIDEEPRPDIIISDIMMDEMDGYEFREALVQREGYKSIPFIFVTARTSPDEKIKGLSKGALDFIHKPFMIEELLEKIKSMILLQDAHDEVIYEELSRDIIDGIKEQRARKRRTNEPGREDLYKKYKITEDEVAIIELMYQGLTYFEIGDKLFYSEKTIRNKVHNIYKKCDVHKKGDLLALLKFQD